MNKVIENEEYACGSSLVPDNPRRRLFIVHRELACEMSMEVSYYSAKGVKLPHVCFHCGGNLGAVLANDADILELQKLHVVVRSICTFCKNTSKKPATRLYEVPNKKVKKKTIFCVTVIRCEIIYLFVFTVIHCEMIYLFVFTVIHCEMIYLFVFTVIHCEMIYLFVFTVIHCEMIYLFVFLMKTLSF